MSPVPQATSSGAARATGRGVTPGMQPDGIGTDLVVVSHLQAKDADQIDLATRSTRARGEIARRADVRPVGVQRADVQPAGTQGAGAQRTDVPGAGAQSAGALPDSATDLDVFSGRKNLAQALILRLLTPQGSLAALGHPDYGSRLHELIGRRKDGAQRNLCRAFVLAVVAQEPRVEDTAVSLAFDPLRESHDSFVFTLIVQPKAGGDPLAVSLEVGL